MIPATAVAAGAMVRVHPVDPSIELGSEFFVRPRPIRDGRLVALAANEVRVIFPGRLDVSLPASTVRKLEVRTGAGRCARATAARAACTLVGAASGALAFRLIDTDPLDPAVAASVGAVLGAAFSFALGRDRWRPVSGWPPPAR